MNTKKLKQLVLDLAIHGKLVPQDPNDEPASVLLERIKAASVETHGRASKNTKGKKSSISSEEIDEVPFEVPEGWCWTRLGDCFFLQAGKNVKAEDISEEQTECAQYRCFGGNGLRGYVNSYNHNGRFPIIGRQGALCGNVNFAEGEFYATEHAVPVHTFAGTDPMWAYHFLKVLNLNQYATATAQPGLSVKVIEEVLIPLPPLAEQHRIVAAIEKWFAVIDQLEKNEVDLKKSIEQTKKKVLDLAIRGKLVAQNPEDEPAGKSIKAINPKAEILFESDEYGEVPEGWCLTPLIEVCSFESGYAYDSNLYQSNGVPLVRISNINNGVVTTDDCVCIEDDPSRKNIYIENGDVLIAMSGATTGKMGVYKSKERAILNQRVGCVRVKNNVILKEYRNIFLESQSDLILKLAYGGAQPNISGKMISSLLVPLPPIAEQKRIVEKVEEVFGVLERIEWMM